MIENEKVMQNRQLNSIFNKTNESLGSVVKDTLDPHEKFKQSIENSTINKSYTSTSYKDMANRKSINTNTNIITSGLKERTTSDVHSMSKMQSQLGSTRPYNHKSPSVSSVASIGVSANSLIKNNRMEMDSIGSDSKVLAHQSFTSYDDSDDNSISTKSRDKPIPSTSINSKKITQKGDKRIKSSQVYPVSEVNFLNLEGLSPNDEIVFSVISNTIAESSKPTEALREKYMKTNNGYLKEWEARKRIHTLDYVYENNKSFEATVGSRHSNILKDIGCLSDIKETSIMWTEKTMAFKIGTSLIEKEEKETLDTLTRLFTIIQEKMGKSEEEIDEIDNQIDIIQGYMAGIRKTERDDFYISENPDQARYDNVQTQGKKTSPVIRERPDVRIGEYVTRMGMALEYQNTAMKMLAQAYTVRQTLHNDFQDNEWYPKLWEKITTLLNDYDLRYNKNRIKKFPSQGSVGGGKRQYDKDDEDDDSDENDKKQFKSNKNVSDFKSSKQPVKSAST
jgi:hypothetical protein